MEDEKRAPAVLAGGCFWCVEAVYRQLAGVLSVESGYAGGTSETAHYRAVCRGDTGHAECVRILFDPLRISYAALLDVFFRAAHDPTQKDRQGNDRGRQYRSAIFYADDSQKAAAERAITQLTADRAFDAPIVTELVPLATFYPAEPYHQDYAARNPGQPYITHVAQPKIFKVRQAFAHLLRNTASSGEPTGHA